MREQLRTFADLYAKRPIRDNSGGMASPHLFATWFALRALRPEVVVESGIFRGQGTWFIEQALPGADLHCIDPRPDQIVYRSPRATYHQADFSRLDWSALPRERTVLFFDDHQDAYQRTVLCAWLGFRHLLFEDNYAPGTGDCYSLKKALELGGFTPPPRRAARRPFAALVKRWLGLADPMRQDGFPPMPEHAKSLSAHLEAYQELPPVFRPERTHSGKPWPAPTVAPLLERVEEPWQRVFLEEAHTYRWICYARLCASA